MAAYIITEKITIRRQEGDYPANIIIIVPVLINMDIFTEVKFNVYNDDETLLFSRTLSGGHITVTDQTIDVTLEASNTLNKEGKYKWECEISRTSEVITVGEGSFIIKNQLISNI